MTVTIDTLNGSLQDLAKQGAKRGWISYEELNTVLPDAFVDPDRLDELLVLFRSLEIRMVNESESSRCRVNSIAPKSSSPSEMVAKSVRSGSSIYFSPTETSAAKTVGSHSSRIS